MQASAVLATSSAKALSRKTTQRPDADGKGRYEPEPKYRFRMLSDGVEAFQAAPTDATKDASTTLVNGSNPPKLPFSSLARAHIRVKSAWRSAVLLAGPGGASPGSEYGVLSEKGKKACQHDRQGAGALGGFLPTASSSWKSRLGSKWSFQMRTGASPTPAPGRRLRTGENQPHSRSRSTRRLRAPPPQSCSRSTIHAACRTH